MSMEPLKSGKASKDRVGKRLARSEASCRGGVSYRVRDSISQCSQ